MNRPLLNQATQYLWAVIVLAIYLLGSSMAWEDEVAAMTPEEFRAAQCRYYNNTLPECNEPKTVVAKND